jgi:YVTN family beta-propeller protein
VTVIDGPADLTTTISDPNAIQPEDVAVNTVTNKVYVANHSSNNVTVIDGATNLTTTITDPNAIGPVAIAVDSVTNKVFVKNLYFTVTVIDGATNSTLTLSTPSSNSMLQATNQIAVNSTTHRAYVVNYGSDNITVIANTVPFSSFSGKLELNLEAGSFDLNARFALGTSASINPPTQPVSLTIGPYSVTIPPGSFARHKPGYAFEGVINGVFLQVLIKFGSTLGTYTFQAEGRGANLKRAVNPVPVTLKIGNNAGMTQINAEIKK